MALSESWVSVDMKASQVGGAERGWIPSWPCVLVCHLELLGPVFAKLCLQGSGLQRSWVCRRHPQLEGRKVGVILHLLLAQPLFPSTW